MRFTACAPLPRERGARIDKWRPGHSCPPKDFSIPARCTIQITRPHGPPAQRTFRVSRRFHLKTTRHLASPQHVPAARVGAICRGAVSPYVTFDFVRARRRKRPAGADMGRESHWGWVRDGNLAPAGSHAKHPRRRFGLVWRGARVGRIAGKHADGSPWASDREVSLRRQTKARGAKKKAPGERAWGLGVFVYAA